MRVGVPRPKASDGAMASPFCLTKSRPGVPLSCAMALMRNAEFSPSWRLTSAVTRFLSAEPTDSDASLASSVVASLVMRMMQPVEAPRPTSAPAGPLTISTCSRLKMSRLTAPRSRMPSTKVDCCEAKPRIWKVSPAEVLPPSPNCMVMPGVLRSASIRLAAPCSLSTSFLTTCTVLGVSSSGWVNLFEADSSALNELVREALTETSSRVLVSCGAVCATAVETVVSALNATRDVPRKGCTPGACLRLRMEAGLAMVKTRRMKESTTTPTGRLKTTRQPCGRLVAESFLNGNDSHLFYQFIFRSHLHPGGGCCAQ